MRKCLQVEENEAMDFEDTGGLVESDECHRFEYW
jgi:hypothetical protein